MAPHPKRILAVARADGGGDVHPLLAAAFGLRDRGHHVAFLCDGGATEMVRSVGVPVLVDESAWLQSTERARAALRALPPAELPAGLARHFSAVNSQLAPAIARWAAEVDADAVLTSLLIGPAAELAVSGRTPWCVVNSTYYLGNEPQDPLAYFAQVLARAPLVLHATDAVFDGAPSLPARQHFVGPLLWEPPEGVPRYLDEPGDPWALVTVSSLPQGDTAIVTAAMRALSRRPVRVLVTMGAGEAPAPSPAVRVERYVSHSAVLARSALMVSHAGHGSVMKALCHGVPMVLVPWGRDQPGVAARAERLGVARVVSPDALDRIETAIADVLDDPRARRAAETHRRRLAALDPVTAACELVETL